MYCNFISIPEKKYFQCEYCGNIVPVANVKAICGNPKKMPAFHRRVANFVKAAINHTVNGNPTVSEEIIKTRLDICKGCELYQIVNEKAGEGVCTHSSCGCSIKDRAAYFNKLAWGDQSCPLGKWGPHLNEKMDGEQNT